MAKNFWEADKPAEDGDFWKADVPADVPAPDQPAPTAPARASDAEIDQFLNASGGQTTAADQLNAVPTPRRSSVLEGVTMPEQPFDPAEGERLSRRAAHEPVQPRRPLPGAEMRPGREIEPRSIPRAAADTVLGLGQGAVNMVKGVADNINAGDNPVSDVLGKSVQGLEAYKSEDLRNQLVRRDAMIRAAQRNGGEIAAARAAFNSIARFPGAAGDVAAQGAGSLIPVLGMAELGPLAMVATNALANAGGSASQTADTLRALPPNEWRRDERYLTLIQEGNTHEQAVAALAPIYALPAQALGGLTGFLSGRTGLERVIAGRGVGTGMRARAGVAGAEALGEEGETLIPMAAGNIAVGAVNGTTPWYEGLGRAAVDTAVGAAPGAAVAAAAPRNDRPVDPERVKALRDAGETESAKLLQRRLDEQSAEAELGRLQLDLASQPGFQRRYRELRAAGTKPVDATSRAAVLTEFEAGAAAAGMSEKAIVAALDGSAKKSLDELPAFLNRYTRALVERGLVQPVDLGEQLAAVRDRSIEAATSLVLGTDTPAPAPEAAGDAAAAVDNIASILQGQGFDTGNDVQVTPETEDVHAAATSPLNDLPEPTQAQKEAGNYKLGRMRIAGMDISVENPQGSVRRGTDADGTPWETPMRHHYGYFRGTTATDGDKLDVFVVPGTPEDFRGPVFVVDQIDPRTGALDEHKVILGARDEAEAESIYRSNYADDWQGLGAITRLPLPAFKAWAATGNKKEALGDIEAARERAAQSQKAATPPATPDQAPAAGTGAVRREPGTVQPDGAAPDDAGADQPAAVTPDAAEQRAAFREAEAKRQARAARLRSAAFDKNPLMAFLGKYGVSSKLASEFAPGQTERRKALVPGYGPVFRKAGLQLDALAERAAEEGYLPPGSRDADAMYALIQRAMRGERVIPQYAEGAVEAEALAKQQASYADFVEAETGGDPLDPEGFTEAELEESGYSDASPEVQAEVRALLAMAEAQGIDAESILETVAKTTENATPQEYYEAALQALKAAIDAEPGVDADRRAPAGQEGPAPGQEQGFSETPDFAVTWPRPQEAELNRAGRDSMFAGIPEGELLDAVIGVTQETGFGLQSTEADVDALINGILRNIDPATGKAPKAGRLEAMRKEIEQGIYSIDSTLADYENEFGRNNADAFRAAVLPALEDLKRRAAEVTKPDQPPAAANPTPADAGVSASGVVVEPRPDGTLAIKGEAKEIRERLAAAGISNTVPIKGGVMVGKTKAGAARAAIEQAQQTDLLSAPTRAEVLDQQDRAATADARDQREQVRKESEAGAGLFSLTMQDGRQDTTGSLFDQPAAEAAEATAPQQAAIDPDEDDKAPQWAGRYDVVTKAGAPKGYRLIGRNPDGDKVYEAGGMRAVVSGDYLVTELAHKPKEDRVAEFRTTEEVGKQTADGPRRGKVGDKFAAGEVVLTASGRETTPFPKFDLSTNRKASNGLKAVNDWLIHNAHQEAVSRGDDFNARQFASINLAMRDIPQADKDAAEEYLFGQQPAVVPSILKPLVPRQETSTGDDASTPADDAASGDSTPTKDLSKRSVDWLRQNGGETISVSAAIDALVAKQKAITDDRDNWTPRDAKGHPVNGVHLYIPEARTKLDKIGWAITNLLAHKKEHGDAPRQAVPAASTVKKVPLSSVIDTVNAKQGQGLTEADRVPSKPPASKTPLTDRHVEVMKAIRDGSGSLEDYKASFRAVMENADAVKAELNTQTKDELLRSGGGFFVTRYRNETKPRIVKAMYDIIRDEYALGKTYGPNSYMMGQEAAYQKAKDDALRALVEGQTEESLAEYAAEIKASRAEAEGRRAARKAAIENPQTLQDFRAALVQHIDAGKSEAEARLMLTPEQRVKYDELWAETTREAREARKRAAKTEVRAAGQTTTGEIVATKHTRDGYDLFVVRLADRVSSEDYKTLLGSAKRLGGWYSSFRGNGAIPGFQFKEKDKAEAFLQLAGGDTTAAQEQAEQRRDAFEDDRSQTAVERLNEMADRLESRAEESLSRDRKVNTDRRARFAARAEASAEYDKAMAKTMRNIAAGIENGTAKFLDTVRQKVQVEMLASFVQSAKTVELRTKYPAYIDQERHKGERPTQETADYAEFPSFTAYRSDLANLGRRLLDIDGTKLLGQRLLKVADDVTEAFAQFAREPGNYFKLSTFSTQTGKRPSFGTKDAAEAAIRRSGYRGKAIPWNIKRGEWTIIMSPSEAMARDIWKGDGDKRITLSREFGQELVQAIGRRGNKRNELAVPWQFETAATRLKSLSRMGIETPAEFRSALREFIRLQEQPEAPNKVKELERAMIGRAKDGLDFFPTSPAAVDDMIEAADIQEGMTIYEPQAGMGHIADRLREAGFEPDVGEISHDRRQLLEAKGYNLVSSDFMDVTLDKTPDGKGYDRILMNPPFSDRRDAQHVQHGYALLKPGGRMVAIMGEGVFFGQDRRAQEFRDWLERVGGMDEKLPEGTFMDPSLPVNTSVNARMVVIDKPASDDASLARGALWRSELRDAIENVAMKAGPASAWNSYIDGLVKRGVKPDEIEWSGVREWLALQTGRVTKEEVLRYLDGNGVRVEEVMLGQDNLPPLPDGWEVVRDEEGDGYLVIDDEGETRGEGATELEARRDAGDPDALADEGRQPKYGDYTLAGGKNYRELLLTLPVREEPPASKLPDGFSISMDRHTDPENPFTVIPPGQIHGQPYAGRHATEEAALAAALQRFNADTRREAQKDLYQSPHWPEKNVLAHIRVNDRIDADGNSVLFVEEIQSDWGQRGKKEGFRQTNMEAQIQQAEAAVEEARSELESLAVEGRMATRLRSELRAKFDRLTDEAERHPVASRREEARAALIEVEELRETEVAKSRAFSDRNQEAHKRYDTAVENLRRLKGMVSKDRPPLAPFVNKTEGWLNLALKRIVLLAAQNGYDRVAFVNGQQSADRYELSKFVGRIEWQTTPVAEKGSASEAPTSGRLRVWPLHDGPPIIDQNADVTELADLIGKDLAEKIVNMEPNGRTSYGLDVRGVSGDGLKVGGEGMKAFYDQIVPQAAGKLIKKLGGGEIKQIRLPTRETVRGGEKFTYSTLSDLDGKSYVTMSDNSDEKVAGPFNNWNEAHEWLLANDPVLQTTQIAFDITPAMRERAAQGLPMFARSNAMDATAFRRAFGAPEPMSVDRTQKIVDELTAKWTNGPSIQVVPTAKDLPGGNYPSDSRGLLQAGRAYIVAANNPTRDAVARTLGHEAIGHYGLWKSLGNDGTARFQRNMQLALASGNKPLNAIRDKVRRLYVDKNGRFNLTPEQEANEIAAFTVEEGIDPVTGEFRPGFGWLKQFWAKIAAFLRDALGLPVRFTDVELQGMLISAMQGLQGGQRLEGGADMLVAAARQDQPVALPDVIVANTLGAATSLPDYPAAKAGDIGAAVKVARVLVTDKLAAQVREAIGDSRPVVVPVVAEEAAGRNKIPRAAAEALAAKLGLETADGIVQANQPHRTGMDGLDRLFAVPDFTGPVEAGRDYLLLDDTLTQGATFAALASHIRQGGGRVIAAVALTGKQYSATIEPSGKTLQQLREKHGDLETDFRAATGYGFDALTQSEARYLANYEPAERLRDRIAAEGRRAREGGDPQAAGSLSRGARAPFEPVKTRVGTAYKAGDVALAAPKLNPRQPGNGDSRIDFKIRDRAAFAQAKADGRSDEQALEASHVGFVTLDVGQDGQFKALRYIMVFEDQRRRGTAAKVVGSIMETLPDGASLHVYDILPGAVDFWARMGAQFPRSTEFMEAHLTRQQHRSAYAQQQGSGGRAPDQRADSGSQVDAGRTGRGPAPDEAVARRGPGEQDQTALARGAAEAVAPQAEIQRAQSAWRDASGRVTFAPGKWLYDALGNLADPLLTRLGLKMASPELRRQLRLMKLEVQKAQDVAVAVAREAQKLSDGERQMVSDIIEKELAAGIAPPEHAVRLAAIMSQAMGQQSKELVRLGMLSPEAARRWEGSYLPRFYESKLRNQVRDAWADAARGLGLRPKSLRGIKGKHLMGRGMYETIPEAELANYEAAGWEVRDPDYQPGLPSIDGTVQVWRDYTRAERDAMGEIRDAGFRFVMGYMQTQRDIALGKMFEAMAADPESSSRLPREGWVRVPDVTLEGTGAKRYGRLSGRYVPMETLSHLTQLEEAQSAAWQLYRSAMAVWKEGKTALNPVAHTNNILSNLTMAHFAGVSYHRWDKYLGAIRDLANGADMVKEARDAGLFLGTISDAELMSTLPPELKALARQADSKAKRGAEAVYNAMTFWLRKPMGAAYQAEDTFFRYLIYRDARQRNATPEEAVEYAQRYIFTYDDLPKGARMVRDFGLPFFAYTYKAVPALLSTALTRPDRFMAPAAVLWTANMAAYAIAAGDDDESWDEKLRKYLNDPGYRAKVREQEQLEREFLPPWMKGTTALMTPKTIRLGTDELTKLPLFLDTARIIPGGDLFDVTPNAGGIPLPQPITPSHPLITMTVGMLANKDLFLGRELVDANDDRSEAAAKRTAWIWKQMSPAIAVNNYHWERGMNALAQAAGGEVKWMPDVLGGDATGIDRSGNPVQPKYAVMQTFGVKMRPIDIETAEFMDQTQRQKMVRDIDAEMRKLMRLNAMGAIPDRTLEKAYEKAQVKKERLMEGLTVDGDSR